MADYETNPILALWKLLPPEARKSYGSMVNFAGELSPGAAVRDVVDESGNMVKAAQSGNWIDAASGPAKMSVAALGVMPFVRSGRMTAKAAQETLAPIRAYHASPHSFDKFEMRPRTGEGANTYGHGVYVAESPEVSGRGGHYDRQFSYGRGESTKDIAARILEGTGGDYGKATTTANQRLNQALERGNISPEGYSRLLEVKRHLINREKLNAHIYEVDVHADPKKMLDWDRLASQQPQLDEILSRDPLYRQVLAQRPSPATGEDVYHMLSAPAGLKNPANASAALSEAGVPGIKYLDAASRNVLDKLPDNPITDQARKLLWKTGEDANDALTQLRSMNLTGAERAEVEKVIRETTGQQTRNYVVFDPKIIDIMKKYGMAPVAAGGGAAAVGGLLAPSQGETY